MEKEFKSLSDKECIDEEGCFNGKYYEEDIKETVKRLKEEFYDWFKSHTGELSYPERIDKFFGDKLI